MTALESSFTPETTHGMALADSAHFEPVHIYCDDPELLVPTLVGVEYALALRFGADLDGYGYPRLAATKFTWEFIREVHGRVSTTKPREMHIDVALQPHSAESTVTVPLPAAGSRHKAVIAPYRYEPKTLKRQGHMFVELGRKTLKTAKVGVNPYFEKAESTTGIIRGVTVGAQLSRGMLGTR